MISRTPCKFLSLSILLCILFNFCKWVIIICCNMFWVTILHIKGTLLINLWAHLYPYCSVLQIGWLLSVGQRKWAKMTSFKEIQRGTRPWDHSPKPWWTIRDNTRDVHGPRNHHPHLWEEREGIMLKSLRSVWMWRAMAIAKTALTNFQKDRDMHGHGVIIHGCWKVQVLNVQ